MEFSLAEQTVYFLASIVMGAALAAVYDLIRAIRMLIRCSRIHIFISDILFFFLCGVLTSLFALPFNKGDVRAFILFGEAIGFLTYRLTLGSLFGKLYAVIARVFRRFIQKYCEKLKKIYDSLLKAGAFVLYNIVALVDGLCRTAISGVKVLASEARSASAGKRKARREKKRERLLQKRRAADRRGVTRRKTRQNRPEHAEYYDIPLRRDDFEIKRTANEQKGFKTRKKREKTRKNRTDR